MAARGPFESSRLASYDRDLRTAKKKRFKKNVTASEKFAKRIENLEEAICADPYATAYGSGVYCTTEGYPNGYARDACMVRKVRFKIEGLSGAASLGRLLVEVDPNDGVVKFLAFYTHADYPGDYEDADLAERLTE